MKPTDFSTPILVVPAMTAPLTTLTTISTEITSVSRPNAMMNGTHGAMALCSDRRASSQDAVPASAPEGSAARSAATSALIATAVPAPENWYSICACPEPPVLAPAAAASAGISDGSTHASEVLVIEVATPTTTSFCEPTVIVDPGVPPPAMTTWLSLSGQWPWVR